MELYELIERVVQTLERLRIPYLVTGSVASWLIVIDRIVIMNKLQAVLIAGT